ncbi:MAG: F0F1 ATP synthase subunit delta [Cardiobacteriaceae bacterium]|nr:F0F1 ATP synthase subunit delta [Cardiobacteriaceae bacterium]
MAESKTIARPYAKAILANAKNSQQQQEWQQFLHTAKAVMQTPEVLEHLALPGFVTQLQTWLGEFLKKQRKHGISSEEHNLLMLLEEHDRIAVLPEVADVYDELFYAASDICMVRVTTAKALSQEEQKTLRTLMQQKTGCDVVLEIHEDATLLAGVLIEYNGLVIDQTLKGRIVEFAQKLDD